MATGDLTDARTKGPMGSRQYEEEWQMYSDVIKSSNVTKKTLWLDVRGNHDDFNVYDWKDKHNYYRTYSVQGPKHSSHYIYTIEDEPGDVYSFIGVDACLQPGPKRPFNFIGVLQSDDIRELEEKRLNATKAASNMTLWFGHYPTSSLATPSHGLKEIINGPYFCGHFHLANMYATQPSGFLEVELQDWKNNRKYRVAAIDHGLFSFTDVTFGDEWPLILITNPKPTMFGMGKLEPMSRIGLSTHLRVLVYSDVPLRVVQFKLDSADNWTEMRNVENSSLYVAPWNSADFKEGLHLISVQAVDEKGKTKITRHQFSLDGIRPAFSAKARFLVRLRAQIFFKAIFFTAVALCVLPLLTLRLVDWMGKGRWLRLRPNKSRLTKVVAKFYLLTCVNKLFLPLVAVPLYATFGPWFVGYVVDGHLGTAFVWGLFVEGSYLPGGFTYVMATLFLLFTHIPVTCCLAHSVHCRYNDLVASTATSVTKGQVASVSTKVGLRQLIHCRHLMMLFVLIVHLLYSLSYLNAYGWLAWFTGIMFTWTFFLYIFLWWTGITVISKDFSESARPRALSSATAVAEDSLRAAARRQSKEEESEDSDLLDPSKSGR